MPRSWPPWQSLEVHTPNSPDATAIPHSMRVTNWHPPRSAPQARGALPLPLTPLVRRRDRSNTTPRRRTMPMTLFNCAHGLALCPATAATPGAKTPRCITAAVTSTKVTSTPASGRKWVRLQGWATQKCPPDDPTGLQYASRLHLPQPPSPSDVPFNEQMPLLGDRR